MTIKKTLTSIVLVGTLALGGAGCDTKSNEDYTPKNDLISQTQSLHQTKDIEGEITYIDEDSFPIGSAVELGGWGADFQYEHIRIKDSNENERKFVIPQSSGYRVGDKVKFSYIPSVNNISFEYLFRNYTQNIDYFENFIQKGSIDAEGIIIIK